MVGWTSDGERFEMTIVDVFTIVGRGVVVVGPFLGALPHRGDRLVVAESGRAVHEAQCAGIEWMRRTDGSSDVFGVLMTGIEKESVHGGQTLTIAP